MDRSILRLPDPASRPPGLERRRAVRQKLHTPVYVSFQSPHAGMIVDLNELLDLHENGFAVQTAVPSGTDSNSRLEVARAVPLRLDLTETKNYVDATGEVMWIDHAGRAGIRFSSLPDRSRYVLKEWLFANLLIASTNHASRHPAELAQREREETSDNSRATGGSAKDAVQALPDEQLLSAPKLVTMPAVVPEAAPLTAEPTPAVSDQSQVLSALEIVHRQVRDVGGHASEAPGVEGHEAVQDYENVLQMIACSAMNLTAATGAALALMTNDRMICRASIGDPAPPLGSEVDVRSGLSGECICSGLLVSCEDTEADLRVDPEVCRAFRIGSFMAAPIFLDSRVIGLLEIFSPYPHTFTVVHATILERLVELIPPPGNSPSVTTGSEGGAIRTRKG